MATHSSVLAWRIPWTGDSPLGCKELDTTEGTEHTHRKNSGLPSGTSGKEPPANAEYVRDMGSIPGLGGSPGGGHGYPLQCSCLENPMDRGAWRATVHRVAKSQT